MASNLNDYNKVWDYSGAQTATSPYENANYSHDPDSPGPDMSSLDGKRKRVGFTEDTTPPSFAGQTCSSESDERHREEEVLSPEALSARHVFQPSLEYADQAVVSDTRRNVLRRNDISETELSKGVHAAFGQPYTPKPKPAIRKIVRTPDVETKRKVSNDVLSSEGTEALRSGLAAHDRAQKLAARVGSYNTSASPSGRNSEDEAEDSPDVSTAAITRQNTVGPRRPLDDEEDPEGDVLYLKRRRRPSASEVEAQLEARRLVRTYTQDPIQQIDAHEALLQSGQVTPTADQTHAEDYVPKPEKYRGGVLASLLKLRAHQEEDGSRSPLTGRWRHHLRGLSTDSTATTPTHTPGHSPPESGATTPRKHGLLHWPREHGSGSGSPYGLTHLVASSSTLALPTKEFGEDNAEKGRYYQHSRPGLGKRTRSSDAIASALKRISKPRLDEEVRITVHIAETIQRQKYLVKLCRALMQYGAPTHRLEEYMKASSRVLEIEAQFMYLPGCMIVSFDDPSTHTTEVKLVRVGQGVDLGKLRDTHRIYKEVVHDVIGVEEATKELDDVTTRTPKFNRWFLVFIYGLASVSVGPFAFQARLIDLPIAFLLGCLLGFLQLIIAPRSELYANVFEITAAVATSFLARVFGSIRYGDGTPIFCFSALAQSSIALILPGYTLLLASLELQSRSIVAGSVRMVYAIIYSLFLGFGITIGTVVYGMMNRNAISEVTCHAPMPDYYFFFFVPCFTMCLIIINQAKWKQAPVMLVISFAGYLVNFFTSRRFRGNTQVSQTLAALAIGVAANLYARVGRRVDNWSMRFWDTKMRPYFVRARAKLRFIEKPLRRLTFREPLTAAGEDPEKPRQPSRRETIGYGMAAAAMLPAIFVQVPSGLAVSGSLVAGITSADQIVSNATGTTTVSSGTDTTPLNSAAFNVGYSVIQVAIGITVGLFLSAVVIYPFGKNRRGGAIFSF